MLSHCMRTVRQVIPTSISSSVTRISAVSTCAESFIALTKDRSCSVINARLYYGWSDTSTMTAPIPSYSTSDCASEHVDSSTSEPVGSVGDIFAPNTYQYTLMALQEEDISKDPIVQFERWFAEARASGKVPSPEAATLATAELPSGRVSARQVLMKIADARGFGVFSNWDTSKKARDVRSNPRCALAFWWEPLQRQIRIEGIAQRMTSDDSACYFALRPRGSQIGAWASPQSTVIANRSRLDELVYETTKSFADEPVPVPQFWGGVRIIPDEIEFWQGRKNRLHDRLSYKRSSIYSNDWEISRLAP